MKRTPAQPCSPSGGIAIDAADRYEAADGEQFPEDSSYGDEIPAAEARAAGVLQIPRRLLGMKLGRIAPAVQTLTAVVTLSAKNAFTFRRQSAIAEAAGLPLRTCRRHLSELVGIGLLTAARSTKRRTVTYSIVKPREWFLSDGFLPLPLYARRLKSWPAKLCYAAIVYRAELTNEARKEANAVSLRDFSTLTGLGRKSVLRALAWLNENGGIRTYRDATGRSIFNLIDPKKAARRAGHTGASRRPEGARRDGRRGRVETATEGASRWQRRE